MASPPIPLRVLLVEDSEDDADLNIRELKRGGYAPTVLRVETREDMRKALQEREWDLVLSDFALPSFSGPEALAELRSMGMDLPFILISGTIGKEAAVAAMKAGAGDYLVKGNLSRLLPAVARELRDAETRRQHKAAREELALQEERLRQGQKMEAVGRLAGGIAHDFNNMLTVMAGYSDIALAELEPGHRIQESLKLIRASVDKAAAITRQLLAFSRRQVMAAKRFDLEQSVQDLARMLGPLIPENIRLEVPPSSRPAPVCADPGQIQQVVMNLVLNARDALPKGGTIRVEVSPPGQRQEDTPESAGPWVTLSVTDNGVGMDAETLSHVFEPFFTTKGEADGPGGRVGTGLGLATAYGIVRQSGGHIKVSSDPGKGTRFRIWLPAAPETAPAETSVPAAAPPDTRGSESVLVAEDDADLRELIRRILSERGYRVLECADGEAAVKTFEEEKGLHLLITDMVLPGMGGKELASRLARKDPGLRVLYISGYIEAGQEAQEQPAGAGYLEKPFAPDRLLQAVRQALSGPQASVLPSANPLHSLNG